MPGSWLFSAVGRNVRTLRAGIGQEMSDMITIGRCKECRWRNAEGHCTNDEKLHEDNYTHRGDKRDHLVYCYYESGDFWVGPEFGCVHWSNDQAHGRETAKEDA